MSEKDKDLFRIKENPRGVGFKDLGKIILRAGFRRVNIRGSHYVYKKRKMILTLDRPHGGHTHCHWLDVKDVIKILEEG